MGIRHLYPYNSGTPVPGGSAPVFGIGGYPTVSIQVIGTMAAGSYTPQVSNDGSTWADIQVVSSGGTAASTIDAVGAYRVDANGFSSFRLLPDGSVTSDHVLLMFASEEPFSRPGTGGGAASEVDLTAIGGTAPATGNGTASAGTLRVAIASNNTAFGVNLAQYTPASGRLPVDGSGVTQPVSAASLPLPTGAATSALQTTGNTSLATLAGAVSGTEMQADVLTVPADPFGVNADAASATGSISAKLRFIASTGIPITSAIPAGTNLVGRVSASNETSTIYNGTTALTPKFAVISAASSGDNTVLAAVASNKIRVVALTLISSGSVSVRFESGAGGTALTGVIPLVAQTGFTLPYNPVGWFETAANTLLNLELSAATGVYGCLTYIEVP
jgi:hypothetical protein